MSNGGPVQAIANLIKGQDRGNAAAILVSGSPTSQIRGDHAINLMCVSPFMALTSLFSTAEDEIERGRYVGTPR